MTTTITVRRPWGNGSAAAKKATVANPALQGIRLRNRSVLVKKRGADRRRFVEAGVQKHRVSRRS